MIGRREVEIIDEFPLLPIEGLNTHFVAQRARHLIPTVIAVRDYGCRMAIVRQRSSRFKIADGCPVIAIVGDDTDRALGPDGFHRKSVARFLSTCRAVSVVSSGAEVAPYAAVVSVAIVARKNVAVIETRPEREESWSRLVRDHAPTAQLIICQPRRH